MSYCGFKLHHCDKVACSVIIYLPQAWLTLPSSEFLKFKSLCGITLLESAAVHTVSEFDWMYYDIDSMIQNFKISIIYHTIAHPPTQIQVMHVGVALVNYPRYP